MGFPKARLWVLLGAGVFSLVAARPTLAQDLTSPAASISHPPKAPAIGVRLGGDSASTRVVVDLAAAPTRRILAVPLGDRQIILSAAVTPDGFADGPGRGLVTHWRLAPTATGAQVVLDLTPGVVIQRRFLMPPSGEITVWRYVLDLAPAVPLAVATRPAPARATTSSGAPAPGYQAAAYRSPARGSAPTSAVATDGLQALADELTSASASSRPATQKSPPSGKAVKPLPSPRVVLASASMSAVSSAPASDARHISERLPPDRRKVIVIDAGHGGHDTGAQSLVRNEKDINLAAAQALKARLERTGRYRVVMTRNSDIFIPLEERVQIARRAKADLFISLHSDSAGSDPTPHGASVYTLSDRGVTRVHDVMGPQDSILRGGDKRANLAVSQILLDLTERNTRNRSAEFAGILLDHISGSVDLLPRSQRDANYFVLLAPDVPAVLMEMGFITNPSDELRLTDPDQRRRMMDKVGEAIDDYFAPHAQMAAR